MPHPDHTPFPFDEIERDLDGLSTEDARNEAFTMASSILRIYLRWMLLGREDHPTERSDRPHDLVRGAGKRAYVLAWVMAPQLLDGRSLRSVARQLGMSKSELNRLSIAFSDHFGVYCRAQMQATKRHHHGRRPQSLAAVYRSKVMSPPAGAQDKAQ